MTNQSPKSAYELAMEKLEAQDQVTGEASAELSPEQIEAIANARQDYEAKLAECKILHQSQMVSTFDPAAREELGSHDVGLRRSASYQVSKSGIWGLPPLSASTR